VRGGWAKLVLVMGHSACGSIKGAIDGVQLGHLTGLLEKIAPAVAATRYSGDRTSKNGDFVDAVARTHVTRTIDVIRNQGGVLARLEQGKKDQDRGLDVLPSGKARRIRQLK
jgi:carbonic anhydrase